MPNTLIPIQTYTLTSSASSITFSNIPQNYTDLKIVISARNASSNVGYERLSILMQLNGSTSTFTNRFLSSSNPPSSFSYSNGTIGWIPASDSTSNTFSNIEVNIFNYAGSSNKSYSVDNFQTNSTADYNEFNISLVGGIWSTTSAITSVGFTFESGSNIVSGSTFTLYGISNGVKATGGTVTVAGGYAYHTFTSTGSFLPSQQIKGAEFLMVAGGGGGGLNLGGGGGAGGLVYSNSQTLNAGQTYTALVGAGGAGGVLGGASASNGSNSIMSSISAIGGGAGGDSGTGSTSLVPLRGKNGGSGGGATGYYYEGQVSAGTATQGSGVNFIGYGNAGGVGEGTTAGQYGSAATGGGGGAGAVGTAANRSWVGGKGGDGILTYSSWGAITGTGELSGGNYYYAGGGGGAGMSGTARPAAGLGGGGAGGVDGGTDSTAGTANTGGGGGGSRGNNTNGKAGGSGLIIIRYPLT